MEAIQTRGFFTGYNEAVWVVILLQAAGGLVSCFTLRLRAAMRLLSHVYTVYLVSDGARVYLEY